MTTHQPDNKAVIDLTLLRERLWRDEALLQEIACAMRDDIVQRGARLREAVTKHDATAARHEAHALKGGLVSITAQKAADLAGQLEQMAKGEAWEGSQQCLATYEQQALLVQDFLECEVIVAQ